MALSPRRIDFALDDPGGFVPQLLALRGGQRLDAVHSLGERGDQRVLARRRAHELLHLRDRRAQYEARRDDSPASQARRLFGGFGQPVVHLAQPCHVVSRVAFAAYRVHDGHQVRQPHVRTVKLFQRKVVVEEWLVLHDDLELPLHDVGRDPLGVAHPRPVEGGELLQPASRLLHRAALPLRRFGCELPVQAILLLPGK